MDKDVPRGDRCGDYESHRNFHSTMSSWSLDGPSPNHDRSFDSHDRGGFTGDGHHNNRHHCHHRHNHHSNHRYHNNFHSDHSDSVGENGSDVAGACQSSSLSGRKRQFPDSRNGGNFVKLYAVGISRTATEQEVQSVFEQYGTIVEVVLLKDKRTGQQGECCFVKYATLEEADRAIGALHKQFTFPGGMLPIRIKYADGERGHGGLGAQEYKLFVGCLNKQASKKEIEEIFSAYGVVEEIYLVRDELHQNRGYGFIQFSHRDMAVAAMNALGGSYVMRGCDQPLIIRFADPKKPRNGDTRDNSRLGGSKFGPRFQDPAVRPTGYLNDPMAGQGQLNVSHPPSPKTISPCSQVSIQSPWPGGKPQTVSATSTASEPVLPVATSSGPAVPISIQTADSVDCDWSEHTCPDGYKYYYNCVTCESRWEKPEEYSKFEQLLQNQQQLQQQQLQYQHSSCQQSTHMQVFLVILVWKSVLIVWC
ncbi:hypothetical protein NMG60_11035132 [Bertholletia excelsa]